ncbi:siderophore-interacting protein [Shigella flexneri]
MVLGGEALDGFTSRGFDDHGKPLPDLTLTSAANGDGRGHRLAGRTTPPSRNYTPLYDDCAMKLAIDFFIHDGGVASGWAINLRWQVRAVRWWCRKITRISCMSAMNPECPHCAAAWKR